MPVHDSMTGEAVSADVSARFADGQEVARHADAPRASRRLRGDHGGHRTRPGDCPLCGYNAVG